jgi:hypothetical protein
MSGGIGSGCVGRQVRWCSVQWGRRYRRRTGGELVQGGLSNGHGKKFGFFQIHVVLIESFCFQWFELSAVLGKYSEHRPHWNRISSVTWKNELSICWQAGPSPLFSVCFPSHLSLVAS